MQTYRRSLFVAVLLAGFLLAARSPAQIPAAAQPAPTPSAPPGQTHLLNPPPSDGPFVIQTGFQLLDIIQVDDQTETFEFSGILTVRWKDPRQAFNPEVEGVQEKILQGDFQFDEIAPSWYPEVVLMNVAGMMEKRGLVFRIRPDGTSTLVESVNAVAKSELALRRFPFDQQRLQAIFAVMGYSQDEIVLEPLPVPQLPPEKIRVPQWRFKGTQAESGEGLVAFLGDEKRPSVFVFAMQLHREAMFVMRLVVLPLFLVVTLSWSVFWMDRASIGDRMSVSFVGLLTVVAYQIVLGDILPHISYLTLTNVFVNFSFMLMCASIVVNLVVGEFDRSGRRDASNRLDLACRRLFPIIYGFLIVLTTVVMFIIS